MLSSGVSLLCYILGIRDIFGRLFRDFSRDICLILRGIRGIIMVRGNDPGVQIWQVVTNVRGRRGTARRTRMCENCALEIRW